MKNPHCYLFALEVAPMKPGDIYNELPLHCTLMHRFWSALTPEELAATLKALLAATPPVTLSCKEKLRLGPKQVPVSELELTPELKRLHMHLYEALNELRVEYTAPEWVGGGYRAHITERNGNALEVGGQLQSRAVYLIEVNVPGYEHQRLVRARIALGKRAD